MIDVYHTHTHTHQLLNVYLRNFYTGLDGFRSLEACSQLSILSGQAYKLCLPIFPSSCLLLKTELRSLGMFYTDSMISCSLALYIFTASGEQFQMGLFAVLTLMVLSYIWIKLQMRSRCRQLESSILRQAFNRVNSLLLQKMQSYAPAFDSLKSVILWKLSGFLTNGYISFEVNVLMSAWRVIQDYLICLSIFSLQDCLNLISSSELVSLSLKSYSNYARSLWLGSSIDMSLFKECSHFQMVYLFLPLRDLKNYSIRSHLLILVNQFLCYALSSLLTYRSFMYKMISIIDSAYDPLKIGQRIYPIFQNFRISGLRMNLEKIAQMIFFQTSCNGFLSKVSIYQRHSSIRNYDRISFKSDYSDRLSNLPASSIALSTYWEASFYLDRYSAQNIYSRKIYSMVFFTILM